LSRARRAKTRDPLAGLLDWTRTTVRGRERGKEDSGCGLVRFHLHPRRATVTNVVLGEGELVLSFPLRRTDVYGCTVFSALFPIEEKEDACSALHFPILPLIGSTNRNKVDGEIERALTAHAKTSSSTLFPLAKACLIPAEGR